MISRVFRHQAAEEEGTVGKSTRRSRALSLLARLGMTSTSYVKRTQYGRLYFYNLDKIISNRRQTQYWIFFLSWCPFQPMIYVTVIWHKFAISELYLVGLCQEQNIICVYINRRTLKVCLLTVWNINKLSAAIFFGLVNKVPTEHMWRVQSVFKDIHMCSFHFYFAQTYMSILNNILDDHLMLIYWQCLSCTKINSISIYRKCQKYIFM